MKEIIKTSRLEIKPYKESDRMGMIELLTNNEIKKTYMIPDFQTEEELTGMVKKLQEFSLSEDHFERGIYADDNLIGFVNDVEIGNDIIELGYVIHPVFHNNGYATEMLKSVIDELLHGKFSTVVAGAFVDNSASIRVMQKCGMVKIEKEDDVVYQGVKRHCVYFAASIKE